MRAGSIALGLAATLAVAFNARVSAHRLDEFLQAARIAIERDRVQLEIGLTPGTAVADDAIRELDADRNGDVSPAEARAYAGRVVGSLRLRLDGSAPLHLRLEDARVTDVEAVRAGNGAIVIRADAGFPPLSPGAHRLEFRNGNAVAGSVYLANALVPEDSALAVTGQERSGDQREVTIAFTVRATSAASRGWAWLGLAGAALALPRIRRRVKTRHCAEPG